MSLPCFLQVLCMTRYTQVDHIRILVTFVHMQKEYYSNFDLQVLIPELMMECKLNSHPT